MNSRAAGKGEAAAGDQGKRGDGLLTTGDMARLTGNTLRTVRFYEEAGILRPDRRSAGGHRLFSQHELERLKFITDMRAASLSLEEIRTLLELKEKSETGQEAAESAVSALDAQIETIKDKIAVFTRLQDELVQARELLDKCRDCSNERCFPNACSECTVVKEASVPQSMRVLWALK